MTSGPAVKWRSGAASDAGVLRPHNEDRCWADDEHGIFLVVDGMGGHAAGELAAQTAVDAIRVALEGKRGAPEDRVRRAIATANNAIFEIAQRADELRGMACVLTLALLEDGQITIGHVGDSRLYVIWNGAIRKLTADHSPVGEWEDAGELSQEEAMSHPRRNEVFRDVGSRQREPGEEDFIDIRTCQFKSDAAFLLCSDGLTDQLTSAQIREIVDRYRGDPATVVGELVEAANDAGGKDNVSVVLVAGPDFRGRPSSDTAELPVPRRVRAVSLGLLTGRMAFLLYGLLIGMLLWAVLHVHKG
jgi:serine/threonine protein phosphatase PrpC